MSTENQGPIEAFLDEIDPVVYSFGLGVALLLLVSLIFMPETSARIINTIYSNLTNWFTWFYLVSALAIVLFVAFLIFGPWGSIRLGKPDMEPEHSYSSYFAMLFSAGIAAGIVFWAPAEPILYHSIEGIPQTSPIVGQGAELGSLSHWLPMR